MTSSIRARPMSFDPQTLWPPTAEGSAESIGEVLGFIERAAQTLEAWIGARDQVPQAPRLDAERPVGSFRPGELALLEESGRKSVLASKRAEPTALGAADQRLTRLQDGAMDVARRELAAGVRTDPRGGANRGARVDEYARDAKMPVGLAWCGFFAQYAYGQAAREGGGSRTDRMQLHSMQKARSYFMYRDYTNASGARNRELDALRGRQASEGSARRYFVLEGSAGERFAKASGRPHEAFAASKLPIRSGDTALFSKGHIGLVESYDPSTQKLTTIEGNSTGGAVRRSTYDLADPKVRAGFEGFGRPALSDFELPTANAEPASAESASAQSMAPPHVEPLHPDRESRIESDRPSVRSAQLPDRPADAAGGHELMERAKGLSLSQREELVAKEIEKGNVPDFLRSMKEVDVSFTDASGERHEGRLRVLPDYLAVGSNEDFVRVPLTPKTAQALADKLGYVLPTRRMVDQIHAQAAVKLVPEPMTKDREKVATFEAHNARIEAARGGRGTGELTSGHKKDIVVSAQLATHPDRVAIYGWHKPDGKPIQPLSTIHDATYVDYSHGARFVADTMIVDGREVRVADVLGDRALAGLISDEGPISRARATGR